MKNKLNLKNIFMSLREADEEPGDDEVIGQSYYFDNSFLSDYISAGTSLSVCVNGVYYRVPSKRDLINLDYGIGYDTQGKPYKFKYHDIDVIDVDGKIMDIEMLQQTMSDLEDSAIDDEPLDMPEDDIEDEPIEKEAPKKSKPKDTKQAPPKKDAKPSASKEKAPPKKEKEEEPKKEESIKFGDYVQNINENSSHYKTRGSVVYVDRQTVEYKYYSGATGNKPFTKVICNIRDVKLA